jgi:hypothetical protein
MTIKVTYEVGKVGDLMVDKFDLTLRQFFRKYLDGEIEINHNDIVKIEVV